jgi:DNA-binding IclR family transcriptional regulator
MISFSELDIHSAKRANSEEALTPEQHSHTNYSIAIVTHTLRVLETFLEQGASEQSVKTISDQLQLSRSRAFRILSTLRSHGYVVQDPESKRYRLGLKLFQLGQRVASGFKIARVADPILADLTEKTKETSYVYALDGLEAVAVSKRECEHAIRISAELGRRDTLRVGAACNLLLAYLPQTQRDQLLDSGPLPQLTKNTLTDPQDLRERLAEIRRLGYHLSRGEEQEGVDGLAAPIRDSSGQVVAAVAIAGPSVRFVPERTGLLIPLVCEAGRRISRELGFLPSINPALSSSEQ